MERVISLSIAVAQTRTVSGGAMVGYGGAHVATGSTRLATYCARYADGLPRSLSDGGAVYFRGQRPPIVGRVSMDSMTVDISGLPNNALDLGRLEVIGPHQTLEKLAADASTISLRDSHWPRSSLLQKLLLNGHRRSVGIIKQDVGLDNESHPSRRGRYRGHNRISTCEARARSRRSR